MAIYDKNTASTGSTAALAAKLVNRANEVPDTTAGIYGTVGRAIEMIQKENYTEAVGLLRASGYDATIRNMLGVCLLRLGDVEEAVQIYRSLVLQRDSVMVRPEVSDVLIRNFATALLLKGLPSGAIDVLKSLRDPEELRAVKIRAAIVQWEKSLNFFRWLDWKWNTVEPPHCKVPIEFEPGELEFDTVTRHPDAPNRRHVHLAA